MQKRILFIIGNNSIEPLGVAYLSAQLKKHNYKTDCFKYDRNDKENNERLIFWIKEWFRPTIVAISMTTGQHVTLMNAAKIIKKNAKDVVIIAGGAHPTYFPQMQSNEYIDYIVRGEADILFPSMIDSIIKDKKPNKKVLMDPMLPEDLDSIPFPDRDIIYKFKQYADNPVKNVLTSRGCPFSCTYCYAASFRDLYKGQKIVRYRSARNVIDECVELKNKYFVKMIFFADDEFSMNKERLIEMSKLYRQEVNLPFHCQIRIDLLTEEKITILKTMGCKSLTFAIESGNETLRKKILNRNISDNDIINGAKLLKKYNIKFRAENMIGLPFETRKEMLQTVNLNQLIKPDYAWCSIYQPFPSTPLGDYCQSNGLFANDVDFFNERFSEDSVLKISNRDKLFITNLQRFFSLFVEFPILKTLILLLDKVPTFKFFNKIRDKWKMYCYNERILNCR